MKKTIAWVWVAVAIAACTGTVSPPSDGGTGGGGGSEAAGGGTATGGGGASDAGAEWPSWRRGLTPWTWTSISGSSLSNQPVPNPMDGTMVTPTQRIDAWNGLAANTDTSELYLAAAGGHADWAGNEVYAIDLSIDAPRWRMLRGPSAGTDIVFGANYYLDGRPSSTHLYYALHFVRAQGRIFKLSAGSVWGSGNESNSNVDGFSLSANDWDPMGTWDAGTPHCCAIDRAYAQHPVTDDVYTLFGGNFRKWRAADGTWSVVAARPSYANDDIVSSAASVVDPVRERVIYLRNLYKVAQRQGLAVSFGATPGVTDVSFTGADATETTRGGLALQYVPALDAYFLKSTTAGDVYRIDPTSFAVTKQATSGTAPPDAVNGIYTRFLWLPKLGGFAYLPKGAADFFFLAVE